MASANITCPYLQSRFVPGTPLHIPATLIDTPDHLAPIRPGRLPSVEDLCLSTALGLGQHWDL